MTVDARQNDATEARQGWTRNSVWVPYAKRLNEDGTLCILARNEVSYPTDFPIYEWQTMPLAKP